MAAHLVLFLLFWGTVLTDDSYISYYPYRVACNETYIPDNCGYPSITLDNIVTGEDFERCAPATLPIYIRNFFWSGAGRKNTYMRNFEAFKRATIVQRILADVSRNSLTTTVLGSQIRFPVGLSPVAAHTLANSGGELATARAVASAGTVMILSSLATTSMEDVAKAAFSVNRNAVLWMQTYIYRSRPGTISILRRAERSGYRAIVVTVDTPKFASTSCSGRNLYAELTLPNIFNTTFSDTTLDLSVSFQDLAWLVATTSLPVVAKGVQSGAAAIRCARAGVSAVIVSNHGGRQLDSERGTLDSLPEVVSALHNRYPRVEVYLDSGVRNGWDVNKVLALGAKAAFVGRPTIWGLAIGGQRGVGQMLNIIRNEFNESMLIAGYSNPAEMYRDAIHNLMYNQRTTPVPFSEESISTTRRTNPFGIY